MKNLALAVGLLVGTAMPGFAQTSHMFLFQFKLAPIGAKAVVDNPQDRTATNRKLFESLGGKLLGYYVYPPGEYDGFTLAELPDESVARASALMAYSSGNFEKLTVTPLFTAEDWKGVMEKARQMRTGVYTPPTETK